MNYRLAVLTLATLLAVPGVVAADPQEPGAAGGPGSVRIDAPPGTPPEILEQARRAVEETLAARRQEGRVFVDAIDVRVVEVEVVVTDEAGERVRGLGRDDFRLSVAGREVPIEYFAERRGGVPVPAPGEPAEAAPGVQYLVFLDDYFTDRRYRGAVLERAAEEIDVLRPGDRMAVVRFRGRGVETLVDWTDSKADLQRVLEEARKAPTWELRRNARLAAATNPANRVKIVAWQIEDAQKTLTATMRAFSGVPGRKVLLLLSSGWPVDLPHFDTLAASAAANRLGGPRLLRPVTDTANLLGYTIYTFHLGGLGRNPSAADREPRGPGPDDPGSLAGLHQIARETGGRSFAYATVIPRPLSAVAEDTADYYSLGFRASMVGDGGLRTVSVQVDRPGAEVRHRRGYRDLTRDQRADLEAEAALFSGETSGPWLDVELGEPGGGFRTIEVPFTIRIPMDWVVMLPAGDGGYAARLDLRVAALDHAGDRSELSTLPVEMRGPRPAPGSHSIYQAAVELRRKRQRVVFTLTDPVRGESLTSTVDFEP